MTPPSYFAEATRSSAHPFDFHGSIDIASHRSPHRDQGGQPGRPLQPGGAAGSAGEASVRKKVLARAAAGEG
jgi:hypothetical protein